MDASSIQQLLHTDIMLSHKDPPFFLKLARQIDGPRCKAQQKTCADSVAAFLG